MIYFTFSPFLQRLCDALLTMTDTHLNTELLVDVLSQMLGGIDRTVLTSRTAKREHQRREASLDITAHMGVSEFIHRIEEGENLTVVLQKADDWLIKACQLLIRLVSAWVMGTAAIKDVAATIAALVFRNAFPIGETEHLDYQWALCIIFGESGRTILRMCLIWILVRSLIAVSTTGYGLNLLELR